MDGVAKLRRDRGEEKVSFHDVADHLVDFTDRHPESRDVVDRLATFLAEVEEVDHSHENDPDRGLVGTPEDEVPQV